METPNLEPQLEEALNALVQNNADRACEILQELIPKANAIYTSGDKELDRIYMIYDNVSRYYLNDGMSKKALKIIGNLENYIKPLFDTTPEKYIRWYADTLKRIALIFENNEVLDNAYDMYEYIWALCSTTKDEGITLRSLNDLCRLKAKKGEIDFCLETYAEVEKKFDLYGGQKNKMADVIHFFSQCLYNYGLILWKYTDRVWEAYRIMTKTYCSLHAIKDIPYVKNNEEFIYDINNSVTFLERLDKQLNTNIIDHAIETVVAQRECSGVFLLIKCGLFGELQQQCIEEMIQKKIISHRLDGNYDVLMNNIEELHQSIKNHPSF